LTKMYVGFMAARALAPKLQKAVSVVLNPAGYMGTRHPVCAWSAA